MALIPLRAGDTTIGLLQFNDHRSGMLNEEFVEFHERLAASIAIALQRRQAEQRLQSVLLNVESYNQELQEFAFSVSHDLRAPLRAIDGFSAALEQECGDRLDATGSDYLRRVRTSAARMKRLLEELLGLSRLSEVKMSRERIDLSATATDLATELRRVDPDRQADIVIQPELVVSGDATLIRFAMQNLLENAWKYTSRKNSARIEVGVDETGDEPVYFVRDNGVGFDMAYADRLFGVFQRLHTAEEYPGDGVGLASVRRVIHRHGGRVWAEGTVDQGAAFYFTIPEEYVPSKPPLAKTH